MTEDISFICWKWHTPGSARKFQSAHVNVLYAMIARWYPKPFRFICVTDDPKGLDSKIKAIELPVRFDQLTNPYGEAFPNCYCRLWNFSREAEMLLGERIFQLDIDVVITGDLTKLVDRPEDFVGWSDKRFQKNKIAGGAYMLRTGALPHIWEDFDPLTSPAQAFEAGNFGSDQGWMSLKIRQGVEGRGSRGRTLDTRPPTLPTLGIFPVNTLVKINWTQNGVRHPPPGSRLVFTNGVKPPWSTDTQRRYPWVTKHWRL